MLINKCESVGLKRGNHLKAFIEFFNDMDVIYENIKECNPKKTRKILIIFDDMIADMLSNKKFHSIVTQLFIKGRKLNISLAFLTQSYFAVPKNNRRNYTYYFIMKIPNKQYFNKLQLINYQILNLKTLLIFTKNLLQGNIIF